MTRKYWMALATLALALATIPVLAQQPPMGRGGRGGFGPGPGGPGPGPMPMLRGLDLTDAQREQIRTISEAQRDKGPGPGQRMAELQKSLQLAILADNAEPQKLDELKAAIAAVSTEELAMRIDVESRIAQVLTPEQRAQARDAVDKMGPPPNGRRGGRGPGRR